MTTATNDYQSFLQQQEQARAIKQARVRVGVSWLLHLFVVPPITSLVYSIKTENYIPVLAATGAAIVASPLALVDFGFTLAVAPPVTSALLLQNKAQERRRQLGIIGPEQADAMMFSNFTPPTKVEVTVNNQNPGVTTPVTES